MVKILAFDTETTGLPPSKWLRKYELKDWPYMLELAFILYDTEESSGNNVIYKYNNIIKVATKVSISDEAVSVHNITKSMSRRKGVSITDAIGLFRMAIYCADVIVGHNIDFDINIVNAECMRNNIPLLLMAEQQRQLCNNLKHKYVCTMNWLKGWLDIKTISKKDGEEYVRFPTLEEVHEKIFGERIGNENLHNAFIDTVVCLRCYVKLTENKDIGLKLGTAH